MSLPVIEAMAVIALAGMDPLPVMRSRDAVFVHAAQAVARRVLAMRVDDEVRRDQNLAVRIACALAGKKVP